MSTSGSSAQATNSSATTTLGTRAPGLGDESERMPTGLTGTLSPHAAHAGLAAVVPGREFGRPPLRQTQRQRQRASVLLHRPALVSCPPEHCADSYARRLAACSLASNSPSPSCTASSPRRCCAGEAIRRLPYPFYPVSPFEPLSVPRGATWLQGRRRRRRQRAGASLIAWALKF